MHEFAVGIVSGIVVMIGVMMFFNAKPESVIIKHGCAEYNKTTGDFQWKDK